MQNPPEYRAEPRLTKKGPATAVIRVGQKGGKRVVAVYTSRAVAVHIRDMLNANAPGFEV